jgi:hypothetical protein
LDWNDVAKTALTAVGSGGSAFLGAFLRFKQRLAEAEANAKKALEEAAKARGETAHLEVTLKNLAAGWRLEFDGLKSDFNRDLEHREELDAAREEGRASRRDPTEDLRHEVDELKKQLERMRERQARFVRNETFVDHVKAQEQQWREIARTMGRLDALTK